MKSSLTRPSRFVVSGAIAGAVSAFIFTVIHDILISDIWFSLVIMLAAGAICGACLSWSYSLVVKVVSLRSWVAYNLLYDAMIVLLGLASVLIFEPVTSMAALIAVNGPPEELISQAMPFTIFFTLLMAISISVIYGINWSRFGVILLTSVVLVLLLGLNVSVIGLVSIPRGSWYLVMEMFALILALNFMYAIVFVGLERRTMLLTTRVEMG